MMQAWEPPTEEEMIDAEKNLQTCERQCAMAYEIYLETLIRKLTARRHMELLEAELATNSN